MFQHSVLEIAHLMPYSVLLFLHCIAFQCATTAMPKDVKSRYIYEKNLDKL